MENGKGQKVSYLGEKPAGTEEGKEVPVAEPLCKLETAVGITTVTRILPTRLHVRRTEFVE
jgi:hypothetical protein